MGHVYNLECPYRNSIIVPSTTVCSRYESTTVKAQDGSEKL